MSDQSEESPLMAPPLITEPGEIDLETGPADQIQCRICLETDGRDFIAPCKCKGTSKYVHRECLDHWRAVKEGFAFAHCTTCKAPYHLRVHVAADRKWRTLKFRFFVTRDILSIFLAVQLVIASLAYLVYLIDSYQHSWLRLAWGFESELSFYYICGALLFFALLGLSGCFITCYDRRVRNDLAQPCRELCLCCCQPGVLVATMVGQRIWQRHYHILAKRMLTKEYVVEDVDGEMTGSDWSPPPLPPEHVQQLKTLGLL
ncbi:E3 ubiquitin-protein ligase MARCH8-like isoform X2 [Durio zibethinus]|uniref:E3 ubiquitin-protein ligase MARCH8-like isoform X2 n=1 Tax=Durio zibethinus TaxID=66656 RepID=A0A6P6BCV5_DURZI|nr:E3 ubiquitin-protein ligase MARCH8-like isoform X2 [Durio zibethinus]